MKALASTSAASSTPVPRPQPPLRASDCSPSPHFGSLPGPAPSATPLPCKPSFPSGEKGSPPSPSVATPLAYVLAATPLCVLPCNHALPPASPRALASLTPPLRPAVLLSAWGSPRRFHFLPAATCALQTWKRGGRGNSPCCPANHTCLTAIRPLHITLAPFTSAWFLTPARSWTFLSLRICLTGQSDLQVPDTLTSVRIPHTCLTHICLVQLPKLD